jgi:tRNA (guanine-N7-)-methyltransferase
MAQKKHNKRRIVQPSFVQDTRQKLSIGSVFHMATDWQPYAKHMMEVMETAEGYLNQAGANEYLPQPDYRPSTKFQRRGEGKDMGFGT